MQKILLAFAVATLTACGGGGGGSSDPTPTPSPVTNAAPQASDAIITDVNGGLVKPGDVLSFAYKYSDAENDAEGESRIQWLLNNEVITGAVAKEYSVLAGQEGQQVSARIIPVAQTGETEGVAVSSNALTVAIDGAPSAENIKIQNSQDRFKPGALLTASYDYSDAENDSEDTSEAGTQYRWLRNGEAISGAATKAYTLTTADEGQSLTFEVTPIAVSGTLQGPAFLSAAIQVEANTAPVVTAAIIVDANGGDVRNGDRLNASYTYSDAENDAEGESRIQWLLNNEVITGAVAKEYSVLAGQEGQQVSARIIPVAQTGETEGVAVSSNALTVAIDGAPSAENIKIQNSQDRFKPGALLTASYDYSDAENDSEDTSEAGTQYRWLRNGEAISGAATKAYTLTTADEGQSLTFEVTPIAVSGTLQGPAFLSAAIQVEANAAPVALNLRIDDENGGSVRLGDLLIGNYQYSDAENNAQGTSKFKWLRNGEAIPGATSEKYMVTLADQGQSLTLEVTPVALSGTLQGPAFLSTVIQVEANAAPVVTAAVIVDANGGDVRNGDRLNASYTYSDEEDNAEGVSTFRWFRGETIIADAESSFYVVTTADEGQDIRYEVTPIAESGLAQGDAVISTPITAAVNQAPTVSNVVIVDKNGGLVVPGDELEVTWDYHDTDGDEQGDTYIGWQYFRPSSSGGIPGSNGSKTYRVSGAYSGQEIQAVITPVAKTGETDGSATRSQKVSVTSLPTVTNRQVIDLNGGDIEVGDVLEAQYTFVDADGDLEDESGARISWYRNGSDLVASGSSKTYTVEADDAGQTLKFGITVRSDAGERSYSYGSFPVQVADAPTLVFEQSGDIKALITIPFVNSASSSRNGHITYSSSDENIATVSNGGKTNTAGSVHPKVAGSVTITATIAAEGELPEISASYDVEIRDSSYSLSGWLSTDKTAITLAGNLTGITLQSTSQANCDLTGPSVCDDYQTQDLEDYSAAASSTDRTASTLNRPGYYLSRYGDYAAKTVLLAESSRFDSSTDARFVEFNGKLWKLGGNTPYSDISNEIWTSGDGRSWVKVETNKNSVFTPRAGHQVEEFQGRLWLTGGKGIVNGAWVKLQDVWSSSDGINWIQNTSSADFGHYKGHSMAVANDRLWIAGGDTSNGEQKVYSSGDGVQWIETASVWFGSNNSQYLDLATVPGIDGAADLLLAHVNGSVYQFGDDKQFTLVAENIGTGIYAKFGYRDEQLLLIDASRKLVKGRGADGIWSDYGIRGLISTSTSTFQVVEFKGETWVIGNAGEISPKTSVWAQRTKDVSNWSTETDTAAFSPRHMSALVSTGDKLVMIGGLVGGSSTNESLESIDGIDWSHKPGTNSLDKRDVFSAVMFNDELYANQRTGLFRFGDDGWQLVAPFGSSFNWQVKMVVHNDKLYLITSTSSGARVLFTTDGESFSSLGLKTPFTVSSDFSAVSFADKLWVIAGKRGGGAQQKVWSSENGYTWVEAQAAFEARGAQQVVVYKDALWLFGGQSGTTYYNDVYRSLDGIVWEKQTDNINVPTREYAAMAVHNDRLYRIGGYRRDSGKSFNDVWSSDDGITWQKAFKTTVSFDPTPLATPVND